MLSSVTQAFDRAVGLKTLEIEFFRQGLIASSDISMQRVS